MATSLNRNTTPDKIPPQSIEAEQSFLGCLMLDKNGIVRVADWVSPGDFYRGVHGTIYATMLELYEKGEPIDLLTLTARLKERKQLDAVGGRSYLTELVNLVPTASHLLHYGEAVKRKKVLRDLIDAAHHIAHLGYEETEDTDILLDEAEKKIFTISQKSLTQDFVPLKAGLEDAFDRIDKLHKRESQFRGIPTGFPDLDNYLAGLQKSDLIILAARPSLGKTSLVLDIARNIALGEKLPVGIFSLEMSKEQVVDRLIASQAGIDLWRLRTGKLASEDFEQLQYAIGGLSEAPIFIDDSPSPTVLQMRAMSRRLQSAYGLGLIIIDYLQLIQPRTSSDSLVQQVTEVSRTLKALARELTVPVLAVSQLSRAVEQRSPQIPRLSDLRESGSLEQDADVVLFIYREDRDRASNRDSSERKNIAEIQIAKHRNGPIGKVNLYFDENRVTFKSLEKQREE